MFTVEAGPSQQQQSGSTNITLYSTFESGTYNKIFHLENLNKLILRLGEYGIKLFVCYGVKRTSNSSRDSQNSLVLLEKTLFTYLIISQAHGNGNPLPNMMSCDNQYGIHEKGVA